MAERSHRDSYLVQLMVGFMLIGAFVAFLFFCLFEVQKIGPWYVLAGVAAFLLCAAAYFISSATVHKVKSDISRKSRRKEIQETFTNDN
ncbi:MAG: hypothetical protein ACKO6Q_09390 [Bacteroidota bacterium]